MSGYKPTVKCRARGRDVKDNLVIVKSCSFRQSVKAPQKSGLRAERGMYSRSGLHLFHPSDMSCWIDHTAGKLVWLFQIMGAASRHLSDHFPGQDSSSHRLAAPASDGRGIYPSTISDMGYDPSPVGPPPSRPDEEGEPSLLACSWVLSSCCVGADGDTPRTQFTLLLYLWWQWDSPKHLPLTLTSMGISSICLDRHLPLPHFSWKQICPNTDAFS